MAGKVLQRLKNVVGAIAPTLASAIGGPVGNIAVGVLGKKFLGDGFDPRDESLLGELVARLETGDVEAIKIAQEAEDELKLELEKIDLERMRLDTQDRAGARDMAAHVLKAGKELWPQVLMSVAVVFMFGGSLGYLLTNSVPDNSRDLVTYMIGQLSGFTGAAFAFWLGSSHGSRRKDK